MIKKILQKRYNKKMALNFTLKDSYATDQNTKVVIILKHKTLDMEFVKQTIKKDNIMYNMDYFLVHSSDKELLDIVFKHFSLQAECSKDVNWKLVYEEFSSQLSGDINIEKFNKYIKNKNKHYKFELILEKSDDNSMLKLGYKTINKDYKQVYDEDKEITIRIDSLIQHLLHFGLFSKDCVITDTRENLDKEFYSIFKYMNLDLYTKIEDLENKSIRTKIYFSKDKRGLLNVVFDLLEDFPFDVNWRKLYDSFSESEKPQTKTIENTQILSIYNKSVVFKNYDLTCTIYEEDDNYIFEILAVEKIITDWKYN